jgi:hypothetical protein
VTCSVDLKRAIPEELVDEFLKKLPYVSESLDGYELVGDQRSRVRFRLQSAGGGEEQLVADRIIEVADKLCRSYRPGSGKLLVSRKHRVCTHGADPHAALAAMDELFEYGPGRYGFGPRLTQLMYFFDRKVQAAATRMAAPEFQFPSLIGADLLERCRYIQSFPSSLTFTSHVREDLAATQEFARTVKWDGAQLAASPDSFSGIQCLLAPSVCFHYYAWLQNTQLSAPRCITAIGKCFRYESRNMVGLERLWDFTMREIIFVGSKDHILEQRQHSMDLIVGLLDEWGLSYELRSATDPFFIDEYSAMAGFQLAFDLKFEILAPLPYKNKDLAVGSFNYHQDFFGKSLGISLEQGEPAHTGCFGFGLERLALAFLAQHGPSPATWPSAVAKELDPW